MGVHIQQHGERLGCWANYRFAAEHLLASTSAPFLLICEDDIFLALDAALALQDGVDQCPKNFGYLSLYTPLHSVVGQRIARGWQELPVNAGTRGALAYCFSRESLAFALEQLSPEAEQQSPHPDLLFSGVFGKTKRPCYFHIPSLCAHAGNLVSTLGHDNLPGCEAIDFAPTRLTYISSLNDVQAISLGQNEPPRTVAMTSIPPSLSAIERTRRCLASWHAAGMRVVSFNHPTEIQLLSHYYDVDWVPVEDTSFPTFGRHYIPINTMLDWQVARSVEGLLINADIELALMPWELERIRRLSVGELCYLVRYNHHGDLKHAQREANGIDAFFVPAADACSLPRSFLSMGQPWWDYWLPHWFHSQNRPIYSVDFPAAFHLNHPQRWDWRQWQLCGLEWTRLSNASQGSDNTRSLANQGHTFRSNLERDRTPITERPFAIREWIEATFGQDIPKTILEVGAHVGTDTRWLAALPGATVHAIEPDPRNRQPEIPNVVQHRFAISDHDGVACLTQSVQGWGHNWTESSSLKRPKAHLQRYPVTFGGEVEVKTATLDSFCRQHSIDRIDLIWADIQGSEGEMIAGGKETLARTRYLYTEYSNSEMYECQIPLHEILNRLPNYKVVELWQDNVLLENQTMGH